MKGNTHDSVQDYYGKQLGTTDDLKTSACTESCSTSSKMPKYLKRAMSKIHDKVLEKYYGCGLVIPQMLKGARVLDLGCGAGRDVFLASSLVGEEGEVVGVDMTDNMINAARAHVPHHMQAFFPQRVAAEPAFANVAFHTGLIEGLDAITALKDASFDVIVSNCVINLCTDKRAALANTFRLLKEGGEMYFSDVYASRRVPQALLEDPVLYGECVSGALYWRDFLSLCSEVGFKDVRVVAAPSRIAITNPELQAKTAGYDFYSVTVRLFKHAGMEAAQEDYGLKATLRNVIDEATGEQAAEAGNSGAKTFSLDMDHVFTLGEAVAVSGNTYRMLAASRFASLFTFSQAAAEVAGEASTDVVEGSNISLFSTHRSRFFVDCCGCDDGNSAAAWPFSKEEDAAKGSSCC